MLVLNEVSLRRGVKLVLDHANVVLQPGEKASLVGRNGAGKSSLFSLLTHRLQADHGDVTMPPRWRLAEVAQNMPETDEGATDFVLQGDTRLMEAQAELAPCRSGRRRPCDRRRAPCDQRRRRLRRKAAARRRCCSAWASSRPARCAGEQLLGRLAHAAAARAGADVPGRPDAARRADQPPGPRCIGLARSLAQRYEGTMIVISHDREFSTRSPRSRCTSKTPS
jgi:ATP-binding cassette subfamily F protein 3